MASTTQPRKKSRQSISTSTLTNNNPSTSTSSSKSSALKPTLKKRSKSLGGNALEQKILRDNNRDQDSLNIDFDLTPRKRARRSLVPGKSILKSRPSTLSGPGLERTTSDNTLTLNNHTQPLPSFLTSTANQLTSSQLTDQFSNNPLSQPIQASQDTENQNPKDDANPADNSSDMDLSDDHGWHRSSLGSNTTTLLRRVSFAAKAHVRTFGSPLVDPDSSIASSNASAPPNEPPGQPTSSTGETNSSEDDSTADMSIDSTTTPNNQLGPTEHSKARQPEPNSTAVDQPPSKDPFKPSKASRLSMAIPGYGNHDDDDDDNDDDEEGEDETQGTKTNRSDGTNRNPSDPQSNSANQANLVDSQPSSSKTAQGQLNLSSSQEDHERSQDMDITTPFQTVPTNTVHPQQQNSSGPTQQPKPPTQSGIPRLQSSSTSTQQRGAIKSSRLSVALPEYLRANRLDETENLDDITSASRPAVTAGSIPVINHQPPLSERERRAWKTSRLSVVLPEYLRGDPVDDTENIPTSTSTAKPPSQSTLQSSNTNLPEPEKTHPGKHSEKAKAAKTSRLTNFLGSSQEDEAPSEDEVPENLNKTRQTQPNEPETNPETDEDRASHAQKTNKPSQTTQSYSNWDDLSRELDNAREGENQGPSLYSEDSEPVTKKVRSRVSEFLQTQDSSDLDEPDSALIDFHEPASSRASFRPPANRPSLSTPGLKNIQEHEDLINMSFDETSAPKPALFPPGPSKSGPSTLPSSSSEPISRAGSFPRVSLEPANPRLSSIRGNQPLNSASPSRRLSGSLSGSPKKLRLSFASPRRSTHSTGASNQSDQHDSTNSTAELFRSKSADPASASIRGPDSDLHRSSDASHPQDNLHPPGARISHSSSMPPPQTQPVPPSPISISLNEFFEQAEIRFISLSQPRVRNYDQQEQPESQHRVSSFAQQIFAGMVKIPRLRLLESSSSNLRQKTELLHFTTKEHENEISRNAQQYKVLKDWVNLRQKQAQIGQSHPHSSQKHVEDLEQIMNQLRLKKNWVEMSAKKDCHLFDIEMWKTYQAHLHDRTAKLSHDLEMMRKMDSIVKPATESLRERKQSLIEEIRRRKQKLAEIESCDQNLLKALKEEAKDLAAVTEANRRELAESEFERNLWLGKFAELDEEKNEHLQRIEQLKRDPEQTQQCTVQELTRLKNEFKMLQSMLGWEVVRFEDELMEFIFYSTIGVKLHLAPFKPEEPYRSVRRVELSWSEQPGPSTAPEQCPLRRTVKLFFFGHLKAHFERAQGLGRVRECVQQISSMWYQALQLLWEITNAKARFSVSVVIEDDEPKTRAGPRGGGDPASQTMDVRVTIRSAKTCTVARCHFLFDGQEIADPLHPAPLSLVSCKVSPVIGKPDCLSLAYTLNEHVDKAHRGALKDGCLDALAALDAS
ncbi:uncharacterized protein PGTG_01856 [Puccinia graminis f. sp. tritici CRL 75-36-700-3]|uniref:Spc7 kinetochore protein domain-containing protein n=1 Tax=Puccinia graminis f. sp. tritici (strain CRL 75-36-700-3 / race SCCL) TaxID=418459 RepID=E3JT36_PUCGT|nr:uncharacterized protein PGTG_01856 [Puccinia graminis f. sp. tritici CRL 75-36-700-3]EFP75263.1 hypothetical protein PGTG_01856 [Puccinia graminis f. sp. tritici CRL 75-36-700-3]